ncbi:glycosyltransferase [Candidatus Pacearchaeota archaeon]|nr:glycosyltransferase [Candidatus Pacearchaeota archaeon]
MIKRIKSMHSISIIIPAHNEEKRIGKTLEEYVKFFERKRKAEEIRNFEIMVVLNACKDRTIDVVRRAEKKWGRIRHLDFRQGGKGFAIIEGFKEALKGKAELAGFVDADMATSPEAFYDLVKNLGNYDGVIASRRKKGAVIEGESAERKLLSWGFNLVVRFLFLLPFEDTQCGAKMMRREVVESVLPELSSIRWAFDVNLLHRVKKGGFKLIEVPTRWRERADSKLNVKKVPFQMFSAVVRLRLWHSPFRFIVRAYDKLPEKIKIHHNW